MEMNKMCEIRLADAEESIHRISKALAKATTRREAASQLEENLRNLMVSETPVGDIRAFLTICETVSLKSPSTLPKDKVENAKNAVDDLIASLQKLVSQAGKLREGSSNPDQLRSHTSKTNDVIEMKSHALSFIRRDLVTGKKTARELLSNIDKAKPFWNEHIETVAGMVLRDEKFDEGLCALADMVTDRCSKSAPFRTTSPFNILGRDHTELKDLNYTVYFRFPGWSVWGLPLTAHDFWHASSSAVWDVPLLQDSFAGIPEASLLWSQPVVQDCLADTFATFVIGPAYAFACILLLLDVKSLEDRLRAESVFAALNYMANLPDAKPWYAFIPALRASWDEASEQDKQPPPEVPAGILGAAAQSMPLKLNWAAVAPLCSAVLDFLPPKLRYDTNVWSAAGTKLTELLAEEKEESEWTKQLPELQISALLDIRHVLHAGWLSRWNNSGQDSNVVSALAHRVERLCHELARRVKPKPSVEDKNAA